MQLSIGAGLGAGLASGQSFPQALKSAGIGAGLGAVTGAIIEGSYMAGWQSSMHGLSKGEIEAARNAANQNGANSSNVLQNIRSLNRTSRLCNYNGKIVSAAAQKVATKALTITPMHFSIKGSPYRGMPRTPFSIGSLGAQAMTPVITKGAALTTGALAAGVSGNPNVGMWVYGGTDFFLSAVTGQDATVPLPKPFDSIFHTDPPPLE
jgi:hypothetical protein